jgi:hypothetical protein
MVFTERRNISLPDIHIAKDREGERLGYDTPIRKIHGAVFTPYEETRKENETVRVDWMQRWILQEQTVNPHTPGGHKRGSNICINTTWNRRTSPQGEGRDNTGVQKHIYGTIHTVMGPMEGEYNMRVTKKWPHINWSRVWDNLSEVPVPESP